MSRASLLAPLVLLLLASSSACDKQADTTQTPGEDAVDALTRELLDALAGAERGRAQALSNASLAAELDERTVATVARTLTWLGPITSLARSEETPIQAGVERRYRVGFERDEVTLTMTVVGGKVEGFEFDAGQWETLSERANLAAAGTLRVATFQFTGPDGRPLEQPTDPADIDYSLALDGLDAQLREHHVIIQKQVFDANEQLVYRQDRDDDIRFPQAESGSAGGTLTGSVAVPGPGRYELELKITDLVAGKSLVHRVSFELSPAG